METYLTISLPDEGRVCGNCSTAEVEAVSPQDAAEKVFDKYDDPKRNTVLVVEGAWFTHAFKRETVTQTIVTEA